MILPDAARDHVRGNCAHHQPGPAHIDRHDAVPHLDIPFVVIARAELGIERRIVDQHVDLAEAGDRLADQRLDRLLVADVAGSAGRRIGAVRVRDLGGERSAVLDVGDHHAGAFGGERQAHNAARSPWRRR